MKITALIKMLDGLLAETAGEAEVLCISLDTDPLDCGAKTGDVLIFQEEDGSISNVLVANENTIEGWEDSK